MSTPFTSKVMALTGGASGIGLATAHLLAARGAHLSLADRDAAGLESASAALRSAFPTVTVLTHTVDVRAPAQIRTWIHATLAAFGRLDGAANIAGIMGQDMGKHEGGVLGMPDGEEDWTAVLDVNLNGVLRCMREEARAMLGQASGAPDSDVVKEKPSLEAGLESGAKQEDRPTRGLAIVNVSNVAGRIGLPVSLSYCASKHGVIGLTRCAAKDLAKQDIRVNCICPGLIDTPMSAQALNTGDNAAVATILHRPWVLQRAAAAGEVAQLIAFLLSSESSFITGAVYNVDGGWMC